MSLDSAIGKPWRVMGTPMSAQLLLMCKLLFVLLLLHGFPGKIHDPFLPFLPGLDHLRGDTEVFAAVMLLFFSVSGLLLVLNVAVRPASVLLGSIVILALLASKSAFRNHLFICGCFFLLAGLHRAGESPWLLFWQMSLIYVGACLNKAFDPDWFSGRFMHNWLLAARDNPFYAYLAPRLPDLALARFLSLAAILFEAAMAVLFAVPATRSLAIWMGILFHGSLFVLLRGENFGHFLEDILIVFIGMLSWPPGEVVARVRGARNRAFTRLVDVIDWDRRISISDTPPPSGWLEVAGDRLTEPIMNMEALRYVVRYSAGWYVLLFAGYHLILKFVTPPYGFAMVVVIGAIVVALFAPFRSRDGWKFKRSPA